MTLPSSSRSSHPPSSERSRRRGAEVIRRCLAVAAQLSADTGLEEALNALLDALGELDGELTIGVRLFRPERAVVFRSAPARSVTVREKGPRMFPDMPKELTTSVDGPGVEGTLHLGMLSFGSEQDETVLRGVLDEAASIVSLLARANGKVGTEPQRAVKLQQLDKLATVGQTASQIAHEMRNPLTTIVAYSDFLQQRTESLDEVARDRLRRIEEAAKRLQEFCRDLTEYSRPGGERGPLDPREMVDRAIGFCSYPLRDGQITVERTFSDDVPLVRGSDSALVQVFVNLITNATHAMGPGGTLSVMVASEDDRVMVKVADDGCGIDAADHHRVFESYFTTKPQGRGVGLGLTIVRQVVREHGGEVWAEKNHPKGTVFVVTLPVFSLD